MTYTLDTADAITIRKKYVMTMKEGSSRAHWFFVSTTYTHSSFRTLSPRRHLVPTLHALLQRPYTLLGDRQICSIWVNV